MDGVGRTGNPGLESDGKGSAGSMLGSASLMGEEIDGMAGNGSTGRPGLLIPVKLQDITRSARRSWCSRHLRYQLLR